MTNSPANLGTAVLGRTGLEVTRLGYGAAHRRALTDDQIGNILNAVLDSGINFIDTANDYGNSEEAAFPSPHDRTVYPASKG